MKGGLLKKLLVFLLLILIVNALLTAGVFNFTSRNVFANMKAEEMIPRADSIRKLWSQLLRGEITQREFTLFTELVLDRSMWDSSVHVYLAEDGVGWLAYAELEMDPQATGVLSGYLPDILENRRQQIVTTSDVLGIVVGMPVYGVDGEVLGAVFLTKPLNEVHTALRGLNMALQISIVLIFLVLLFPVYLGTRSMTRPLTQMSLAAQAMAKGDFTVRAMENETDEVGQLGKSLNELSEALSQTIGALMLERNRLRNVLDGLAEGVVAVDSEGSATHCNPAALRLLGEHGESAARAVGLLRQLWPEFDTSDEGQGTVRIKTVEANGLQLQITATDLYTYDGKRAGAVAAIQDVTEQVRLEQTRRDYVANVSHELRTPISSIRSLADALNDGLVKKEEDKTRYYGYILRESMRLSRLIDDLLELSRLQSGGVALTKYPFDLTELLHELAERFAVIAGDSGLSFALEMPEEEMIVNSNEDRVEQVLVALLDNAVKYAADEGSIILSAQREEDHLLISVCNTGQIDEAHIAHLFERFYKADQSHSGSGTGLGLSIANEIMTLLGERIWAENCDGGACFRFTLHDDGSFRQQVLAREEKGEAADECGDEQTE